MKVELWLPIPPPPNRTRFGSPRGAHFEKKAYQKAAWLAAVTQQTPDHDPPSKVIVSAHFKLYGPLRDEDGLDLKWVLDALRQEQRGKLGWRQGLYVPCGYFVDDDPAHLTLEKPTQEIDRKNRKLIVTITEV